MLAVTSRSTTSESGTLAGSAGCLGQYRARPVRGRLFGV